jgi:hypothetical protein
MKLATLKTSGRDGRLIVVSRDLKLAVTASEIAPRRCNPRSTIGNTSCLT